ncbi:MAG TPA: DUF2357 domain-containing protein [Caulobacteraceae bacterium]|nr:DUF2357 domain-containing protein [Caulobacteraceae bacterium]
MDERVEYILSFPGGCPPAVARRLRELGGDLVGHDIGVLGFGNFVGSAELAGVTIQVISSKIGVDGVSRLLEEISELAASLVFGWGGPASFMAVASDSQRSPVPYHQLQFLRRIMVRQPTGARLQDWLAAVERSPTRQFEPARPVVSPERVRRLDQRAVKSTFSRLDRLALVPSSASIARNPLAEALTFGSPPQPHFPSRIAAPRGRLSYDTPENRFVKHVIGECLALVYRFVDHPKLHGTLRDDCRGMLCALEQVASAPFLDEAGRLAGFSAPSQALVKADGYREVYGFWSDLTRHVSLPPTQEETTRLLEGRDMAMLYEYWVFLRVLEAVSTITGKAASGPPEIRRDELGETLVLGLSTGVGPDISVHYNPTYRRSAATAYSTPLRPDVVLEIAGRKHAFDAKYRLDRFDVSDYDADEGTATYKRADLYKMHTYRDAIAGLDTAFVVYPGTEFVFFERSGSKQTDPVQLATADGVGAIPLRPTDVDPAASVRATMSKLLTLPPPAFEP